MQGAQFFSVRRVAHLIRFCGLHQSRLLPQPLLALSRAHQAEQDLDIGGVRIRPLIAVASSSSSATAALLLAQLVCPGRKLLTPRCGLPNRLHSDVRPDLLCQFLQLLVRLAVCHILMDSLIPLRPGPIKKAQQIVLDIAGLLARKLLPLHTLLQLFLLIGGEGVGCDAHDGGHHGLEPLTDGLFLRRHLEEPVHKTARLHILDHAVGFALQLLQRLQDQLLLSGGLAQFAGALGRLGGGLRQSLRCCLHLLLAEIAQRLSQLCPLPQGGFVNGLIAQRLLEQGPGILRQPGGLLRVLLLVGLTLLEFGGAALLGQLLGCQFRQRPGLFQQPFLFAGAILNPRMHRIHLFLNQLGVTGPAQHIDAMHG